jgi:membrane-bound lytic murein transglycosylase D
LEGRLWAARLCTLLLASFPLACASGGAKARTAQPAAPPPAPMVQKLDPAPAVIAQAEAHLKAGLAAADEGEMDAARNAFDRAVETLASFPGGAYADPRVAEAYRRALDTVQVREVELAAAATEDEPAPTEPAAIDAVAALPVSDLPASAESFAQAMAAVEAEPHDLPVELNDAVLSCIDLYQGRLRDWFQEALSRGQQYLPEIRRVFAEEGIPQDLAYLALVESAFKTTAYSRAKAKGVFQFISATGKRYGLRVDWWVDERSDPDKATRAAARYLKDLYGLFGDWNLAMAGYNAGEGKVLRGMSRYRKSDYWELRKTRALRPETKNYVPLIHAAIVIAKAPERYGFVAAPDTRPEWESVTVAGAYDLRVVAECAGQPVEALRELNPELRRLATPADRSYELRVPPGSGGMLRGCLAELPADKKIAYRKHVVRRGQTLASIARANGVSAQAIAEANLMATQRRLRPGTELVIPVPAGKSRVVAASRAATRGTAKDRDHVRYRIQPGDTLSSIAEEHGTTIQKLKSWNGLTGTRISAGSVLRIYTDTTK